MYKIDVPAIPNHGVPEFHAKLGRVNVLLGVNGSGKSRLLAAIRDRHAASFGVPRSVVFVEGGRVVPIPDSLKLDRNTVAFYSHYSSALEQHRKKRKQKLSDRIRDALFTLERRTEEDKTKHSDAVNSWIMGGENGACPARDEPPIDRLFRLFSDVLPKIQLELAPDRRLLAKRMGLEYAASGMSDGEKQSLAILADIAMLAEPTSLIIVDEPELNLHPLLASSLWGAIENDFPEAIFVYATHSIGFAMRREVTHIVVLSSRSRSLEVVDPSSLHPSELRPFLGSIPALLVADRALVGEGEDASFDKVFYQWVTGKSFEVIPIGNCFDVYAATTRLGVWERLAPSVRLLGIMDRDFRSDDSMKKFSGEHCLTLDLHEAESYLCFPAVLHTLSKRVKIQEDDVTEAQIEEWIRNFAGNAVLRVAAQRAFSRASISLNVSLSKQSLAGAKDESQLLSILQKESERETAKAHKKLSAEQIEKMFAKELEMVRSAVAAEVLEPILRLFPGKELLEMLAPRLGFKSARQLLVAAINHLSPIDFPEIESLRERIRPLLENMSHTRTAL